MSTKKKLVLLWHDAGGFLEVHKVKDPLLFPLYLSREYAIPYEIVALNSENKTVRVPLPGGGTLLRLANKHGLGKHFTLKQVAGWLPHLILYISYLVKNRKSISHIMLFHWHYMTQLLMFLCRILCPTAKVYLKLDMNTQKAREKLTCIHNAKKPHDWFFNYCMSLPHLTSIESRDAFEVLKADPLFAKRNIAYVPNGLEHRPVGSVVKQKRFFTVGRLGTKQKNTEMLLAACAAVDLKDWQFWFVGGIEKTEQDFQDVIDRFFAAHPDKRGQMIFTGNISNPARLWQIYDESSVFIFPSRHESFGITTIEACYAGCYLVLSEVGCADDVSEVCGGEGVRILEQSKRGQQDEGAMQQQIEDAMRAIIKGEKSISFDAQKRREAFESHFLMENIVKCEAFKAFFAE